MAKINVPELLPKDKLSSLPAKEKNEYLSNALKRILELNPSGITISQIKESTGYTYSTVWHHLEIISASEQCSKMQRGNVDIYFPNVVLLHLNEKLNNIKTNSLNGFKIVENNNGKFLNIYRESTDRTGNRVISSGVLIPASLVKDLKNTLDKVAVHLNEHEGKMDSD